MNESKNAVVEFARNVRAQLGDLPESDIQDLTEGLEADLAESLAEDGSELGDPVAYAQELRLSAGLGARNGAADKVVVRRSPAEFLSDELALFRSHPAGSWIVDFLLAVRPAWWLLRGAVAFTLLLQLLTGQFLVLPRNFLEFLAWAALLVASVQWGRGGWRGGPAGRQVLLATSTLLALLALPFMIGWTSMINDGTHTQAPATDGAMGKGLVLDGNTVTNIFPYDCGGKPLGNVQLYDQDGRKMDVATPYDQYIVDFDSDPEAEQYLLPNQFPSTSAGWNVFPLEAAATDPELGIADGLQTPSRVPVPLPFPGVQPLLGDCEDRAQDAAKNAEGAGNQESGNPAPAHGSADPGKPAESTTAGSPVP